MDNLLVIVMYNDVFFSSDIILFQTITSQKTVLKMTHLLLPIIWFCYHIPGTYNSPTGSSPSLPLNCYLRSFGFRLVSFFLVILGPCTFGILKWLHIDSGTVSCYWLVCTIESWSQMNILCYKMLSSMLRSQPKMKGSSYSKIFFSFDVSKLFQKFTSYLFSVHKLPTKMSLVPVGVFLKHIQL